MGGLPQTGTPRLATVCEYRTGGDFVGSGTQRQPPSAALSVLTYVIALPVGALGLFGVVTGWNRAASLVSLCLVSMCAALVFFLNRHHRKTYDES